MNEGISSKKLLILAVALSFVSHAVLISATGMLNIAFSKPKKETAITVSLEKMQKEKRPESKKEDRVKPASAPVAAEAMGGEISEEEKTVLLDTDDKIYAPYLTKIKKKIDDVWFYPRQAFNERKEGTSTVKFSLDKSGRLMASGIVESSGYELLDRAAVAAVKAAAPYEPFPPNINFSRINILATFRYSFI